jgi:lysyl-tRNA synthetase class I
VEHIVLVSQLAGFDHTKTLDILRRSDSNKDSLVGLTREDVECVRNWLNFYAPSYKVSLRDSKLGKEFNHDLDFAISNLVREFLVQSWTAENIHSTVHKVEKQLGVPKGLLFSEVYTRILGLPKGPRLGFLLESLGRDAVIDLIS